MRKGAAKSAAPAFITTPARRKIEAVDGGPRRGRGRQEVAALGASDNGAVIGSGRLSRRLQTSGSGQSFGYAGQAPRQPAPLAPLDITTLCLLPAARGRASGRLVRAGPARPPPCRGSP
jgi:hypothetical protein